MSEYPLLFFPRPSTDDRIKRPSPRPVNNYSPSEQYKRFSTHFSALEKFFTDAQLQLNADGIDPETALVIETKDSVQDFVMAVNKIDGLEWLTEIDSQLDEDEQSKSNKLYLLFTNKTALDRLLRLWRKYAEDKNLDFSRKSGNYGLAKFKQVFELLEDIRVWNTSDRLSEFGLLEIWKDDVEFYALNNEYLKCEIELWYRKDPNKRAENYITIQEVIHAIGGNIITSCDLNEISYHAIIAEIPPQEVEQIINHDNLRLFKSDCIMFAKPVGQHISPATIEEEYSIEPDGQTICSSHDEPIIALLDGLPLQNHSLLQGYLKIDDPDEWGDTYPASMRYHGTSMASIIIHGDLNQKHESLNRPIYVRPIMRIEKKGDQFEECLPEDILLVDLIHRAVRRIIGDSDNPNGVAPKVKIINLSIGDVYRPFLRTMSPLARLIDWLSFKYDLLFIVSAGNYIDAIEMGINRDEIMKLSLEERGKLVISDLARKNANRRILTPAESINSLTVGAYHHDNCNNTPHGDLINPVVDYSPSPLSRVGLGYYRSIKPDLVLSGGRMLYLGGYAQYKNLLSIPKKARFYGISSACPSSTEGQLNTRGVTSGTSNSTALCTRASSICYDYLQQIQHENNTNIDDHITPILKAMLIHSCSWDAHSDIPIDENIQSKSFFTKSLGYGSPNLQKVLGCNEHRATLIGYSTINKDEAHIYKLPLPQCISAIQVKRKLTVTLAWNSPISATNAIYKKAKLDFSFGNSTSSGKNLADKTNMANASYDFNTTKRGTVQHMIYEGNEASFHLDGDHLEIRVNCKEGAKKLSESIKYALMVTLEVAEGINIPLYSQIKNEISIPIEIKP